MTFTVCRELVLLIEANAKGSKNGTIIWKEENNLGNWCELGGKKIESFQFLLVLDFKSD